jgi:hypothetical protein
MKTTNSKANLFAFFAILLFSTEVISQNAIKVPVPSDEASELADDEVGEDAKPVTSVKEEKKPPAKEEKVTKGIIANSGKYGFGPTSIEGDQGGSVPGEEASVISGGIKPIGRGECEVVVSNSSPENAYKVRYKVVGYTSTGSKAVSKSFSDTIKPGATDSKKISCSPDLRMTLELKEAEKKK